MERLKGADSERAEQFRQDPKAGARLKTSMRLVRERIARVRIAGRQTAIEPLDSLRRRAMCESIRRDVAGGHPLKPVVANRCRRSQPCFDVAGLELHFSTRRSSRLCRRMAPHAGETVGLQFDHH